MIDLPSPNFDMRDVAVKLEYILLHYTGMPTCDAALKRLCDPQAKVSAHVVIDTDGSTYKLVDEEHRAWHAGVGKWHGVTDVNSASIGIELVNPGHEFGYQPFPKAQIAALKNMLKDMIKRHKLNPVSALLGHSDIAPMRKDDPGELFPWKELAMEGLGQWPQPQKDDYAPVQDCEEQALLRTLGYDCPVSEICDPETRAVIIAFQRRYHPENVTGKPELETMARMRALARMER